MNGEKMGYIKRWVDEICLTGNQTNKFQSKK
jgi:hypothetical protein